MAGGDFENIAQITQLGWQHVENPVPNVQSSAQLSANQPQRGSYCLELKATVDPKSSRPPLASSLVSIVSPAVPVAQNQFIEISGWVRIDEPFPGGEGLEISDTLGGPALSLVANQTSGWQPFRMIRAAVEPTQLRLTLSLTGVGTVKVDSVMVRTLEQPIARRLPPAPPAGAATATNPVTATNAAGAPGPRLFAPPTR